jgi:hypothetical protein
MLQEASGNSDQRAPRCRFKTIAHARTRKLPKLDSETRDDLDDWRAHCFPNGAAPGAFSFPQQMGCPCYPDSVCAIIIENLDHLLDCAKRPFVMPA